MDGNAVVSVTTDDGEPGVYGADYLAWKSWGDSGFGILSRSTEKYYEAELKRAGVLDKRELKVLEVGFGNGDFMTFCQRRGWSVTGTEINPELVEIGKAAGFDARIASDLDDLDADSFDLVVTIDVLEHIPPDGTIFFLKSLLRVLRPGGSLVAHFPNADSPFGLYNQNGDVTHVNAIGTGKARYYAHAAGADLVFLHGEARPIPAGALAHTGQRIVALPFRWAANLLARFVFLPGTNIDFAATALTMVLRKRTYVAPFCTRGDRAVARK